MSEQKPAWHVPLYGSDGFVEAVLSQALRPLSELVLNSEQEA